MSHWVNFAHLTSAASTVTLPANSRLCAVVVGTGAASAVLTITNGASGGTVTAINCASPGSYWFDSARIPNGAVATLASGGVSDVTITYI